MLANLLTLFEENQHNKFSYETIIETPSDIDKQLFQKELTCKPISKLTTHI